ncbi:hypothetical protein CPJ18_07205 [Agrobacterium rosae]|uniref:Uncharacterized protein n=1 Tax=Agrobacterium rosae TaxID=1972867 RepID=A0AAE5S095_9HYPH|nr:hypothetical protein DXM21_21725 [Agrobacterium rosae]KAA3516579.1 hypothetical protein DXM25_19935 [Agrobacterium rosae]MQB50386.1 hypothetical protein [Agrobacterium rosae]POO53011.1 hypothetical protein CPJ18_07205 [Agrobacterium rosae]
MQVSGPEHPENDKKARRAIWPWLVLLVVTLVAIIAYSKLLSDIEDMKRTWNDLVQLFWLIAPSKQ